MQRFVTLKMALYSLLALVGLYIVVVIGFETGLGIWQPTWANTLYITTTDHRGNQNTRVLSGLYMGDDLYVRANHWPRDWYHDAMARPNVNIDRGHGTRQFVAVPVSGEEERRVNAQHGIRLKWRILTGFPPLKIIRLDPTTHQGNLSDQENST
ncbi:MAG: hypothetical protein AAF541_16790 [Pseudomonadota bacterium]